MSNPRPWLAYTWLVFSALWIRGAIGFFTDILDTGGPNTGGLVLIIPLAALVLVMGIGGVFVGLALGGGNTGGRILAIIASIAGLIVTALSVPFVLITFIGIGVLFMSGYMVSAIALVATPVLFVVTLIALIFVPTVDSGHRGFSRIRFFGVGAAIVATAFVPSIEIPRPPVPSPEEQRAEMDRYQAAITANDAEVLGESRVWDVAFDIPADDGSLEGGDALQYAIGTHQLPAVRTLLPHRPWRRGLDPYRDRALKAGHTDTLQLLADAEASFAEPAALDVALRATPDSALAFVLAHGAQPQAALCLLDELLGIDEELEARRRGVLIAAGAAESATCPEP